MSHTNPNSSDTEAQIFFGPNGFFLAMPGEVTIGYKPYVRWARTPQPYSMTVAAPSGISLHNGEFQTSRCGTTRPALGGALSSSKL